MKNIKTKKPTGGNQMGSEKNIQPHSNKLEALNIRSEKSELINKLEILKLTIEGFLLASSYASDTTVVEKIRLEGIELRQQYHNNIVVMVRELSCLFNEVGNELH